MPKYKCKDCGAIFYGWGKGKVCPKCGGKLEPAPEDTADKKQSGPPQGWAEGFPELKTLALAKDLNGGPGKSKGGFTNDSGQDL